MQPDVLITGGRIIDASQKIDKIGDLLIQNGLISQIAIRDQIKINNETTVINADGLIVCPGFIDLHCHLREPGYEDKETIKTGTMSAAAGGFTTVCCMPNTNPPIDDYSSIEFVKKKAANEGIVRVLPIACITKGRKGTEITEMRELFEAGAIAFSDDGNTVPSSRVMLLAMEYCKDIDIPIMDHCEDEELARNGSINEGWVSARLGLKGIPAEAEEIIVARDIALAKLTHARLHIAHASTKGTVDLIRDAKEKGLTVTAEVTPHHLTLTEESILGSNWDNNKYSAYNTYAKVNPPLRTKSDIDALIKGLNDGVIDAIATDHAPHTLVDKLCELDYAAFGISGFETAFGCLMTLVHDEHLDLITVLSALTYKPATIIDKNEGRLGTLSLGSAGDIVILDLNKKWQVNSQDFYSKGKNSPYHGAFFKGKVMATVFDGKLVYRDKSLIVEHDNG